jgi:RNA polymerase sigma-70 factor (ECF subfamily)
MAVNDLQLIQAVAAGDQGAFGALDQRYRSRLVGFLQGRQQLTRDEAEDVVQDVYAALVAKDCAALRSFQGRSSFYTYLCAIALRRLYRLRRKGGPAATGPDLALDDDPLHEPREDPRDTDIDAAQVRQAMSALPEQFRTCLMLHHFGGLEYHEISSLLGIPANTVATRICRAKRRLKKLLVP